MCEIRNKQSLKLPCLDWEEVGTTIDILHTHTRMSSVNSSMLIASIVYVRFSHLLFTSTHGYVSIQGR